MKYEDMIWIVFNPRVDLGYLPGLLTNEDPRSVSEQLNEKYSHGGGWRPMQGWTLDKESMTLYYPGDPPMRPLATSQLRSETLWFYQHDTLCVVQSDGTFEVSRVD
jgi:hypothetical protein